MAVVSEPVRRPPPLFLQVVPRVRVGGVIAAVTLVQVDHAGFASDDGEHPLRRRRRQHDDPESAAGVFDGPPPPAHQRLEHRGAVRHFILVQPPRYADGERPVAGGTEPQEVFRLAVEERRPRQEIESLPDVQKQVSNVETGRETRPPGRMDFLPPPQPAGVVQVEQSRLGDVLYVVFGEQIEDVIKVSNGPELLVAQERLPRAVSADAEVQHVEPLPARVQQEVERFVQRIGRRQQVVLGEGVSEQTDVDRRVEIRRTEVPIVPQRQTVVVEGVVQTGVRVPHLPLRVRASGPDACGMAVGTRLGGVFVPREEQAQRDLGQREADQAGPRHERSADRRPRQPRHRRPSDPAAPPDSASPQARSGLGTAAGGVAGPTAPTISNPPTCRAFIRNLLADDR